MHLLAGLFSPRRSNGRIPLPSARRISRFINSRADLPNGNPRSALNTQHLMQVGQFLDHDLTHAPAQGGVNGGE